ncbi:MAG: fructose-1,6-bisphosphatase [Eubacterium sp.]|nr:fructose-1,6-bisphosphatase [Eubacterium sp.]
MQKEERKYLRLLAEKYPTRQSVCREIINRNAILNLPKGTEHFMSDLHGEYEAFYHILNNCSGVIREKVDLLFGDIMSPAERQEICTLIYYPREKLRMLRRERDLAPDWYRMLLNDLVEVAKLLSSKYTRSKVRKAMPEDFSYIIDELLHVQKDEDDNQVVYHKKIIDTILSIENADEFIVALAGLIKRLAVDHLHIVGDMFDRGASADKILDLLMSHHSLDIEWGNHDILWMGAAAGSKACIANVIRNNLRYQNTEILENGYGISLRHLTLFAIRHYTGENPIRKAWKAISVIMFKLEGNVIREHPEYQMENRLLLDKVDQERKVLVLEGREYGMKDAEFPTVDPEDPYRLTEEEWEIMKELKTDFLNSIRLQRHVRFLYEKGSMYRIYNENLLYHGCVPMDAEGNFQGVTMDGITYQGKAYLDFADRVARRAFSEKRTSWDLDFMWYLWCGRLSPLCGRLLKTFERTYLLDEGTWEEPKNPYYKFYEQEKTCNMILREFGLYSGLSHIVNGHTPVLTGEGELPIRAGGKLLVIDGGFCSDYHKKTGIAGYTLIYNSHGLRIMAHQPFETIQKAMKDNLDIESESQLIETEKARVMVKDTDIGREIYEHISDLELLLRGYRSGEIKERRA